MLPQGLADACSKPGGNQRLRLGIEVHAIQGRGIGDGLHVETGHVEFNGQPVEVGVQTFDRDLESLLRTELARGLRVVTKAPPSC